MFLFVTSMNTTPVLVGLIALATVTLERLMYVSAAPVSSHASSCLCMRSKSMAFVELTLPKLTLYGALLACSFVARMNVSYAIWKKNPEGAACSMRRAYLSSPAHGYLLFERSGLLKANACKSQAFGELMLNAWLPLLMAHWHAKLNCTVSAIGVAFGGPFHECFFALRSVRACEFFLFLDTLGISP